MTQTSILFYVTSDIDIERVLCQNQNIDGELIIGTTPGCNSTDYQPSSPKITRVPIPADNPAEAMNAMLEAASDEYIMFADGSTVINPSAIKVLEAELDRNAQAGTVFGLHYRYNVDQEKFVSVSGKPQSYFSLLYSYPSGGGCIMMRKEHMQSCGGIVPLSDDMPLGWDNFLYTRMAIDFPVIFKPVPASAFLTTKNHLSPYISLDADTQDSLFNDVKKMISGECIKWFSKKYDKILEGIVNGKVEAPNHNLALTALGVACRNINNISEKTRHVILNTATQIRPTDFGIIEYIVDDMVVKHSFEDASAVINQVSGNFTGDSYAMTRIMTWRKNIIETMNIVVNNPENERNLTQINKMLDKLQRNYYIPEVKHNDFESYVRNIFESGE